MVCEYCKYNKREHKLKNQFLFNVFCGYINERITPPPICAAQSLTVEGWEKIYNSSDNDEYKKLIKNRILELKSES